MSVHIQSERTGIYIVTVIACFQGIFLRLEYFNIWTAVCIISNDSKLTTFIVRDHTVLYLLFTCEPNKSTRH